MDLARLSSVAYPASGYPVSYRARERVLELVSEADAARPVSEIVERVVHGEVLQRQRTAYSSTEDYLKGRLFDSANSTDASTIGRQQRPASHQASLVASAYLNHTRELIQPDIGRGKQVDYFI